MNNFDYEGAKAEGYTDEEINEYLGKPKYQNANENDSFLSKITKNFSNFYNNFSNPTGRKQEEEDDEFSAVDQRLMKKVPNFDVEAALNEGYTADEINDYLEENIPKRNLVEKGARLLSQVGLGALEMEALPYELGVAPLASKEAQTAVYRENLGEDIERLLEKKEMGDWDEQDQELYDHLSEQLKDTGKSEKYVKTADIGLRGAVEQVTGVDLHPEGVLEKAANWVGFIKDPKKITSLFKVGLKPKEFIKKLVPGTDEIRGLTAGSALQLAEEGNFGFMGTLGAAIIGDVAGFGPKMVKNIIKEPKKSLAQATAFLTGANRKAKYVDMIIDDANKAGIKLDAGTLTQSPFIQMMQARVAQSGLTGPALENFQKELSSQFVKEYKGVVDYLGEQKFENAFQAGNAVKQALKDTESSIKVQGFDIKKPARPLEGRISTEVRPDTKAIETRILQEIAPTEVQNTYQAGENLKTAAEDIRQPIKQEFERRWTDLNEQLATIQSDPQGILANELRNFVREHEGSLLMGESTAEARVVAAATKLQQRLSPEGGLLGVSLTDLIKTKRTLADVANWEFGGSNFESAYKQLVGQVDAAIERTLERANPELLNIYRELNAEYSAYKDLFENKNVLPLFEPKNNNFNAIYTGFATNPDKLRALEDIFYASERGQELIGQVKRDYAQRIITNNKSTPRELRDLAQTLGPQFERPIAELNQAREFERANPLPRAQKRQRLGIEPKGTSQTGTKPLPGRIKESNVVARKKLYNYLSEKDPEHIMKLMDSVEGIRKVKNVLSQTPEGQKLFGELSRYKIDQMIEQKMTSNMSEQVKLGTFSKLLDTKESIAIAKELLGNEAFGKIRLLQKNAGRLSESASKFFNASKSGTVATDVALISAGMAGLMMGNPYIVGKTLGTFVGLRVFSNLLADPVYLGELQKAIMTKDPVKFREIIKRMQPAIDKAMIEAYKNSNIPQNEQS